MHVIALRENPEDFIENVTFELGLEDEKDREGKAGVEVIPFNGTEIERSVQCLRNCKNLSVAHDLHGRTGM